MHFLCSKDVKIEDNVYICSDVKIMSGVTLENSCYIGQKSIIRTGVTVPRGVLVSATSDNKIHNKTKEEVENYFRD